MLPTMAAGIDRWLEALARRLPSRIAARLDACRPSLRGSWGGPFNGQARRQDLVRDVVRRIGCEQIIETGTYRGTTTRFLDDLEGGVPVFTVEASPRYFHYCRRRLRVRQEVTCVLGDSREALRLLKDAPGVAGRRTFFYLDAHWERDLPLAEEVAIIAENWRESAILIDDFQVPGDPGYAFDDYGPGRALTMEYLRPPEEWGVLYPSACSEQETGAVRGCVLLVSPPLLASVSASRLVISPK